MAYRDLVLIMKRSKSFHNIERSSAPSFPPQEARIQSIARAKALLDVLTTTDGDWTPLRQLALATGLAKTTAFNLVNALVEVGLVEHDPPRGAYRLGAQMLVYGRSVERRMDLVGLMRPYLLKLCTATRETVNLALPGANDILIVDSVEGAQTLRVTSYAGTRAAYHSTACGRALLAHHAEAKRRQLLSAGPLAAMTPRTTLDPAAIEAILGQCRRVGYVEEVEENELGAACVAAPLFGASAEGEAVGAVSVAGPLARMGPEARAEIGLLLVATMADARRAIAPTLRQGGIKQGGRAT